MRGKEHYCAPFPFLPVINYVVDAYAFAALMVMKG